MRIWRYTKNDTGEALEPKAHLRPLVKLEYDHLVEVLAANADSVQLEWSLDDQGPDIGKARTEELICEQILAKGASDITLMWHEHVYNSDEVKARRAWAARQITRHWGEEFRAGGSAMETFE